MNDVTALAYALAFLQALPQLVQMTAEVEELVSSTVSNLKAMQADNRDPTAGEWDNLHAIITDLRAKLDE